MVSVLHPLDKCVIYGYMDYQMTGEQADVYEQLARIGKVVVHPKRI